MPVLIRLGSILLIVLICVAGAVAVYMNRKPILIWASGHRYRPRIPAQAQIFRDIEYTVFNGRSMRLDIYTPGRGNPHPLIVWLHSGAWKTLDKSCIEQGAMDQVSRGYALASVDYSLSYEEKWPAQLQQIRTAIQWMGANAATYGINPAATVIWGMSAGGHLASVVGTSADLESGNRPCRIVAVVAWCAPSDLAELSGGAYASARQLLGYEPEADSEKEIPANPLRYISRGDPPFYILHGGKDTVVPIASAVRFRDELEKAGVTVAFRVRDQYVHEDIRFNSAECMPDLERFLDRLCLGKAGSQ
jgi:acetyl esterase/lipase